MKYQFDGIGDKSATATMLLLAATSWGAPFTIGIQGTILHMALKWFYMWLADHGLIAMNVGIADLEVMSQESGFNGSLDDAFKIIEARKDGLTDAEKKKIDDRVISAFDKFSDFGVRDGGSSGSPPMDNTPGLG